MSPVPTPDFTAIGNAAITATANVPEIIGVAVAIGLSLAVLVAGAVLLKRWVLGGIKGH
jgi:hypothetical protein